MGRTSTVVVHKLAEVQLTLKIQVKEIDGEVYEGEELELEMPLPLRTDLNFQISVQVRICSWVPAHPNAYSIQSVSFY